MSTCVIFRLANVNERLDIIGKLWVLYHYVRAKPVIIVSRYTNTLLVSLNNRVYLRDRLSPGNRDTARSMGVRTMIIAQPRSSGAEPRSRASTSGAFQLYDISRQSDLDNGYGDAADTKLPGTIRCSLPSHYPFLSFLNGLVSVFSP